MTAAGEMAELGAETGGGDIAAKADVGGEIAAAAAKRCRLKLGMQCRCLFVVKSYQL